MNPFFVKRLHPNAILPKTQTPGSAGYDLAACLAEPVAILPGQTKIIPTGLAIAIPDPQVAAFIYARSSLGIRHNVVPANCVGVVDSDYRGEIQVGLINLGAEPFTINPGDRIAQLIFAPVFHPPLVEVAELEGTSRGAGGFGSTGR